MWEYAPVDDNGTVDDKDSDDCRKSRYRNNS